MIPQLCVMQNVLWKNSWSLFWSHCKINPTSGNMIILSMEAKWVSFHSYIGRKIPGALLPSLMILRDEHTLPLPSCCPGNQVALHANGSHISLWSVPAVILPLGSNDSANSGSIPQPGRSNTCIGIKRCQGSWNNSTNFLTSDIGLRLLNEHTTENWASGQFHAELGIYECGRKRRLQSNLMLGLISFMQVLYQCRCAVQHNTVNLAERRTVI